MFKVAVGHSIDPDSQMAIEEAIKQCQKELSGESPTAGILLSAVDFDHQRILEHIQKTFPGMALVGGTTVGEMSSAMGFQEDSLTLMVFCSDEVEIRAGLGTGVSKDAITATQQAIPYNQGADPKLCYVIGEGLGVDGVAMVNHLRAQMGPQVPIFGGMAGDAWKFKTTYQFFGSQVLTDTVVTLTFFGNLQVSCGVATGLNPIGNKGTVTKAKGSTVYEVDGQSVRAFYERYFDATPMELIGGAWGGSVAVFEPGEAEFYVRGPNHQNEASGSMDYFGSIPEQSQIQFTESNTEDLLAAAATALDKAKSTYQGKTPVAALLVSCAARMKSLGTRTQEEYQIAQKALGAMPNIGFHAYGEICPLAPMGKSYFHNETFAVALLGT